jgi:diaminohydroxyphosphoribosylaminopyrimidine deaminase/5-amino-6-(5-phosphoribosylamino)uracil reductase
MELDTIIERTVAPPTGTAPTHAQQRNPAPPVAWNIVLAAADATERLARAGKHETFAMANESDLRVVAADDPDALIAWRSGSSWETCLPADDPRRALLDLYLPVCSATLAHPTVVGHLGQSLDGFIATHAGESQWVTGEENLRHLHRLRALCDAVVVGAGTVAADNPQLTTRLVPGPNPLRVVLDPMRRLGEHYRVFEDDTAETLYVCGRSFIRPHERHFGRATMIAVADTPDGLDIGALVRLLHERGCARIFVEGGGVTVSRFFEANLLDRLHLAVAPLFIGSGRPAIRLPPRNALRDCHRPRYRVFRMGADMLFDFDLRSDGEDGATSDVDLQPPVTRVI